MNKYSVVFWPMKNIFFFSVRYGFFSVEVSVDFLSSDFDEILYTAYFYMFAQDSKAIYDI